MKKILISVIAVSLMAVSAFAAEGTISTVRIMEDGTILVKVGTVFKQLAGSTADANKAMYAAVLTAKSTGATVTAFQNDTGWKLIEIQ